MWLWIWYRYFWFIGQIIVIIKCRWEGDAKQMITSHILSRNLSTTTKEDQTVALVNWFHRNLDAGTGCTPAGMEEDNQRLENHVHFSVCFPGLVWPKRCKSSSIDEMQQENEMPWKERFCSIKIWRDKIPYFFFLRNSKSFWRTCNLTKLGYSLLPQKVALKMMMPIWRKCPSDHQNI